MRNGYFREIKKKKFSTNLLLSICLLEMERNQFRSDQGNQSHRGRGNNNNRGNYVNRGRYTGSSNNNITNLILINFRGRGENNNNSSPNYKQLNMKTLTDMFGGSMDRDTIWDLFKVTRKFFEISLCSSAK